MRIWLLSEHASIWSRRHLIVAQWQVELVVVVLVQLQGILGCQVPISMSSRFPHSRRMLRGSCFIVKDVWCCVFPHFGGWVPVFCFTQTCSKLICVIGWIPVFCLSFTLVVAWVNDCHFCYFEFTTMRGVDVWWLLGFFIYVIVWFGIQLNLEAFLVIVGLNYLSSWNWWLF